MVIFTVSRLDTFESLSHLVTCRTQRYAYITVALRAEYHAGGNEYTSFIQYLVGKPLGRWRVFRNTPPQEKPLL